MTRKTRGRGSAEPGRHLVVMAKEPVLGRVKTRLSQGIGPARATSFYRASIAMVIARVRRPRQWCTYLSITPDAAVGAPVWPPGCRAIGQGRGDLGRRMQLAFETLPPGPVIIVGSDVPGITAAHIATAFKKLEGADVVIGPSPDGGYWLIGVRRRPRVPHLFDGVRWSHAETLSDTLQNAAGLRVTQLGELNDIDNANDFARMGGAAGRRVPSRLAQT